MQPVNTLHGITLDRLIKVTHAIEHLASLTTLMTCVRMQSNTICLAKPMDLSCGQLHQQFGVKYARLEAQLSHPSQVCQDVNSVYCIILAYLLNHPHDNVGALARAREWIETMDVSVQKWFHDSMHCTFNDFAETQTRMQPLFVHFWELYMDIARYPEN